jgi:RNA polymerase sigma factor (sigma-70 family)
VAHRTAQPPDQDLVRASLAGDMAQLGALIERHFQMVYAIGLARMRDPDRAEDLAQEVFLRAQLHLEQLGPQGNFAGWVCRIARNLAINWLRQGQRASRLLPIVPLEEEAMRSADRNTPDVRESLGMQEESQALSGALLALPEDQRELVLLHFMSGATQREIAERLGVNQATVSRQIQRALAQLRAHLEPVLRQAVPALRAPQRAVAKSLLIASAVGAMSTAAKASLVAAAPAGEIASTTSAAKAGAVGAAGVCGFLTSLPAIISGGLNLMTMGKGIAAVVLVGAIAGGTYLSTGRDERTSTPDADDSSTQYEQRGEGPTAFVPPEDCCRVLCNALMAGDWGQAESLFFTEEALTELAQRMGWTVSMPSEQDPFEMQRRRFLETAEELRAAGSVEYIGPSHLGRGQVLLPEGYDQRDDVVIDIRIDGQPRRLFFNSMSQMDGRWLILDAPVLR